MSDKTANGAKHLYRNPILPGFFPDPSICRVGDDFYLVNSSFAYFPGIPIHHSRDLVHWRQIGSALDRSSQIPLEGAGHSRGLFAPTIRHHAGTFYITCTNVHKGGNFLVSAKDPAGPWSEPVWLPDAPGIDPSLFFDDDGRAWYCGNRPAPEGQRYNGNYEIWLQEIDLEAGKLVGPVHALWRGALRDAIWPEGPHIYKINGWYYLLISEGGTSLDHALTVARSRSITGPYEGKAANPILTHRHLGKSSPIINVGHGDLFDDPEGNWWLCLLASRPYGGLYCGMGRETFLAPVSWEDEWPLPCPGTGRVELEFEGPALPDAPFAPKPDPGRFDIPRLSPEWLYLRGPADDYASLSERPGHLRLKLRPEDMRGLGRPSFAGLRQRHMEWQVMARMEFEPSAEGEWAGLALVQSDAYQYRLELGLADGARILRLVRAVGGPDETLATAPWRGGPMLVAARGRGQDLGFFYGAPGEELSPLAEGVDGRILSTEVAGGFVGTVVGVFASSNGKASTNHADFAWFEYRSL